MELHGASKHSIEIVFNPKTQYYDWQIAHLSGRCLTEDKAKTHASIAEKCLHLTIKEFHDIKQLLIDVDSCDFRTTQIIKSLVNIGDY